jgi:hypothetical protein
METVWKRYWRETARCPDSTEGRIIAMAVMFVGIGFVALLTAFIADRPPRAARLIRSYPL